MDLWIVLFLTVLSFAVGSVIGASFTMRRIPKIIASFSTKELQSLAVLVARERGES